MRLLSFFLALAIVPSALSWDQNGCNADNCARAVTGTRPGKTPSVSSREADCSSFMEVTITPAPSTVTTTKTVTVTTTLPVMAKRDADAALLAARQITVVPSIVPTYASACDGASRYSSACSCWGITAHTTTAPTPVTTTTVTVTLTASVCPTGDTQCGSACFNLKTSNDNCGACGVKCPAGSTCVNGACSEPACDGKTCGNFANCSPGGTNDCQCYTTADGVGFCAHSQPCAGLKDCQTNADCGSGSVCVVNSCCVKNVCVPATCGNPVRVLKRYEKRAGGDGCWSGSC